MSSTQPASTTELKEYCLRKLGKPVIDVNLADEQMNDMIDESVQFFHEYHFDGTEVYYAKEQVAASTLTFASAATGTFSAEETITGGTSGATGTAHATQATAVVFGNIDTKALTADDTIIGIRDVLPINAEKLSSDDMFSIEYQFNLNQLPGMLSGISGGLSHYATSRQYIDLMDQFFSKSDTRQIRFNRLTDKVYIDKDWDSAVKIGDWLILQCYKKIDGGTYTELYNDIFLKKYTTALFKKQWGANLIKYEGMQLPGGATLNGRQIYDDGHTELEKLEEESQMRYQLPDNFYVG